MAPVDFDNLPFNDRPDLTPYLIHLTKNSKRADKYSAFDNLVNILKTGEIWGSTNKGFVKGPSSAACFMDIPFVSLKYILNKDNCNLNKPRYEPCGIFINKQYAYKHGCRPVLYLSNKELSSLEIPDKELWRVVRFEASEKGWISWIHEREWRSKGGFKVPSNAGVLVRNPKQARELQELILENPKDFKVKPRAIIPLAIVCQGLNI